MNPLFNVHCVYLYVCTSLKSFLHSLYIYGLLSLPYRYNVPTLLPCSEHTHIFNFSKLIIQIVGNLSTYKIYMKPICVRILYSHNRYNNV